MPMQVMPLASFSVSQVWHLVFTLKQLWVLPRTFAALPQTRYNNKRWICNFRVNTRV